MPMRWEDERYVKLYVRDTPNWLGLPWEAHAIFPLLERKVDRAGLLHVGRDPARTLQRVLIAASDWPIEVIQAGLAALTTPTDDDPEPPVVVRDGTLCIRNFVAAQEANQSDRLRKAEQRGRARDKSLNLAHPMSRSGHEASRGGHSDPIRADPSLADPKKRQRRPRADAQPAQEQTSRKPATGPCADVHRAWEALYLKHTGGTPYSWPAKEHPLVASLVKRAGGGNAAVLEIGRRAAALFEKCAKRDETPAFGWLSARWNELVVSAVRDDSEARRLARLAREAEEQRERDERRRLADADPARPEEFRALRERFEKGEIG